MQGGSRTSKDVPPYITAGRDPLVYAGLNLVGLRRRGFSREQLDTIESCYKYIYQGSYNTTQALEQIEANIPASVERDTIINFIRQAERGIIKAL